MGIDLGSELAHEQHRALTNDLGSVAIVLLRVTRELEQAVAALPEALNKMLEAVGRAAINVEAPNVTVQVSPTPIQVTPTPIHFDPEINVPEMPALNPQITVEAAKALPVANRRVRRKVERDEWGRITAVVEEDAY